MKNFLSGKTNFPHFKSKKHNNYNPFRIINNNENVRIKNNSIKLAKYGFVKYRGLKRNITGKIVSVTISFVSGKWFASITFKNSVVDKIKNSGRVVGIDLGVKNLLTFSNGEVKVKLQMKKLEKHNK